MRAGCLLICVLFWVSLMFVLLRVIVLDVLEFWVVLSWI